MSFKMKLAPKKPSNPIIVNWRSYRHETLKEHVDYFNSEGIDLEDVSISFCLIDEEVSFSYSTHKYTDEEYFKMLERYKSKLAEYLKWQHAHEKEIASYKKTRAEKKKAATEKRLKKLTEQQALLTKEIALLEKQA